MIDNIKPNKYGMYDVTLSLSCSQCEAPLEAWKISITNKKVDFNTKCSECGLYHGFFLLKRSLWARFIEMFKAAAS